MPSEREGASRFHDPFIDEKVMPKLFEEFVQNFAAWHIPSAKVRGQMRILWDGCWDEDANDVLPVMFSDVVVELRERRLLIDCKFYREALVTRHNRLRLHSAHLYQIVSYLRNQSAVEGWGDVEGLLLYPAVGHHLDFRYVLNGHPVRVASVDLDRPWQEIHEAMTLLCSGARFSKDF
jgi:5-methylcytosine-specific restriction enzyme subunit McrC